MNYWESRKSFWTTPKGLVLQVAAIFTIFGGLLIALNVFTSPFPVIEFLEAKPVVINQNEVSTLSWSVIGATEVKIDHDIGSVTSIGSTKVSPSETTTYTLTAINGTRSRTKEAKIMVR
jgi:hypothetical protein